MQSCKAQVQLTKDDRGQTWLDVEIAGKKAHLSLERGSSASPTGILADWAASHFRAPGSIAGPVRKTLVLLGECLLAGTITLVLVGMIGGVAYLCYMQAGSLAQGVGLAVGAGLLGAIPRYFQTTRSLLNKLTGGKLFN